MSSRILFLVLSVLFGAHLVRSEIQYPVLNNEFAGNEMVRKNLIEKLFENLSPVQSETVRDTNTLLFEAMKEFNKTMLVEVHAYSLLLSSVGTGKEQCDCEAKQKAEEIIRKNLEETIACLITYRNQALKEGAGHKYINELPTETLEIIVTPLFTCFDDKKTQTVKEVGHAMATHALCVNKL